jgi:hypothetical protein
MGLILAIDPLRGEEASTLDDEVARRPERCQWPGSPSDYVSEEDP